MSDSCDPMYCSLPSSFVRGILRQEYWSGLPFSSSEDPPDPGIKPASPALQAVSLPLSHLGSPIKNSQSPFFFLFFAGPPNSCSSYDKSGLLVKRNSLLSAGNVGTFLALAITTRATYLHSWTVTKAKNFMVINSFFGAKHKKTT